MRIRFDRGTLVLEPQARDDHPERVPGVAWDHESRAWRAPAERHAELAQLATTSVDPPRLADEWNRNGLPNLRWYQEAALARWIAAGHRGVIALPTGSGKTLVALAAIARLGVAALCLVPTRVLLDQWARALAACWPHPVGRLGDGDARIAPITVSTYASAVSWAPRIGDRFGLVIVDEAHHVGAWCPSEVLEMLVAPARLGLTATPPPSGGALRDRIGPVVFSLEVGNLKGNALADFVHETVPIELTPEERERYRELRRRFAAVYSEHANGRANASWDEFVRIASRTPAGRAAIEAWRGYRALLSYSTGKRDKLRELLRAHAGERTLVFTADNATAYAIARELLVVPVTHEIKRGERVEILKKFQTGEISVLVSSQVLDEGFDVPDADIAIIVGGSASNRRHVQRIGRVLRPRPGKQARIYELAVLDSKEGEYVVRRQKGLAS